MLEYADNNHVENQINLLNQKLTRQQEIVKEIIQIKKEQKKNNNNLRNIIKLQKDLVDFLKNFHDQEQKTYNESLQEFKMFNVYQQQNINLIKEEQKQIKNKIDEINICNLNFQTFIATTLASIVMKMDDIQKKIESNYDIENSAKTNVEIVTKLNNAVTETNACVDNENMNVSKKSTKISGNKSSEGSTMKKEQNSTQVTKGINANTDVFSFLKKNSTAIYFNKQQPIKKSNLITDELKEQSIQKERSRGEKEVFLIQKTSLHLDKVSSNIQEDRDKEWHKSSSNQSYDEKRSQVDSEEIRHERVGYLNKIFSFFYQ